MGISAFEPGDETARPHGGFQPILRIVLYLITLSVAMLFVAVVVSPLVYLVGPRKDTAQAFELSLPVLTVLYMPVAIAAFLVTLAFVVLVDRRPAETLGLARRGSWTAEVRLGLAMGFGLPLIIFGVSYIAGWSRVAGSLFQEPPAGVVAVLAQSLLLMAAVAFVEEIIVRGYILQTLEWGYGPVAALIVGSMLFGLAHLPNPGAAFPGFLGTTAAGLVLGYAYLSTRRLWLPVAFHFGWNFALGPIFGFRVSGIDIKGWVEQSITGPAIWLGGEFGPEAGLLAPAVLALGTLAIRFFMKRWYDPGVRPEMQSNAE